MPITASIPQFALNLSFCQVRCLLLFLEEGPISLLQMASTFSSASGTSSSSPGASNNGPPARHGGGELLPLLATMGITSSRPGAAFDSVARDLCLESARVRQDPVAKRVLEVGWNPFTARSTVFAGYLSTGQLWEARQAGGATGLGGFPVGYSGDTLGAGGTMTYGVRASDLPVSQLRGGGGHHGLPGLAPGTGSPGSPGGRAASPGSGPPHGHRLDSVLPRYLQPRPPKGGEENDDKSPAKNKKGTNGSNGGPPPRVAFLAGKFDPDAASRKREPTVVSQEEQDEKRKRAAAIAAANRRTKRAQQKSESEVRAVERIQAMMEWQLSLRMVNQVRQHGAAITIQCAMRRHLAKLKAERLQKMRIVERKMKYESILSSLEELFETAASPTPQTPSTAGGPDSSSPSTESLRAPASPRGTAAAAAGGGGSASPPSTDLSATSGGHPFETDAELIGLLKEIDASMHVASDPAMERLFSQLAERGKVVAEDRRQKRQARERKAQRLPGEAIPLVNYDLGALVEDEEYGRLLDDLGRALMDGEEEHMDRVTGIREALKKRAAQLAKLKAADQARLAQALRQKEAELLKRRAGIQERKVRAKSLAHQRVALISGAQRFRADNVVAASVALRGKNLPDGGDPKATAAAAGAAASLDDDEANGFSEDELRALRNQFDTVDTDMSGDISREEFLAFYPLVCSYDVDKKACSDLFDELDVDGGGTLTFEEFANVYQLVQRREEAMKNPGEAARLEKIQRQLKKRTEAIAKARAEQKALKERLQKERLAELERNKQKAAGSRTIRSFTQSTRK